MLCGDARAGFVAVRLPGGRAHDRLFPFPIPECDAGTGEGIARGGPIADGTGRSRRFGAMKILLDENLPHDLRHSLANHDVFTVAYQGWCGIGNGELLRRAGEGGFDVLVTKDSGVAYQQDVAALPVAVVILVAKTNRLEDLRPLVPRLLILLANLQPRTIARVESSRGDAERL